MTIGFLEKFLTIFYFDILVLVQFIFNPFEVKTSIFFFLWKKMDKSSIFHTETLEKHYKILYNIVPADSGERRKLQKKLELKYGVIQTF